MSYFKRKRPCAYKLLYTHLTTITIFGFKHFHSVRKEKHSTVRQGNPVSRITSCACIYPFIVALKLKLDRISESVSLILQQERERERERETEREREREQFSSGLILLSGHSL